MRLFFALYLLLVVCLLPVFNCKRMAKHYRRHLPYYQEVRVDKVVTLKGFTRLPNSEEEHRTCSSNSVIVQNVFNTAKWRVRNRQGTSWNDELIPPIMMCIKVHDSPFNLNEFGCKNNTISLFAKEKGMGYENAVKVLSMENLEKGNNKCMLLSPCELLKKIYWDFGRLKKSTKDLEFFLKADYYGHLPHQVFDSTISLRGLVRSIYNQRDIATYNVSHSYTFKNVQAAALYIAYPFMKNRFVSDNCISKPSVATEVSSKKPYGCLSGKCYWNLWIGQLSGEGVSRHCTLGKGSANGDYIVGWYKQNSITLDSIGSVRFKVTWDTPENIGQCDSSEKLKNSSIPYFPNAEITDEDDVVNEMEVFNETNSQIVVVENHTYCEGQVDEDGIPMPVCGRDICIHGEYKVFEQTTNGSSDSWKEKWRQLKEGIQRDGYSIGIFLFPILAVSFGVLFVVLVSFGLRG